MNPQAAPPHRLEIIDALRGFALFGVFAANLLIFSGIAYMTDGQRIALFDSPIDRWLYFVERFFIENKFMGLFSFLFGVSFWLFLSRVSSRRGSATSLFYRRIFWLFIIGALHGWLLWCFDILRFYALWAVLLPWFVRTAPRRLLIIGVGAAVLVPAFVAGIQAWLPASLEPPLDYDAVALAAFANGSYRDVLAANWQYDWYLTLSVGQIAYQVAVCGRLLLGLYVARAFDLGNLQAHRALLRRVLIWGTVIGAAGSAVFAAELMTGADTFALRFARRFLLESGQLGMTLAYAAGLALAYLGARSRRSIVVLAPVGRMALTLYLSQTLVGMWTFYGFAGGPALMGTVSVAPLAAFCMIGFAVQVVLAGWWLSRFQFGPAEWLWRSLTYWEPQPFKVDEPANGT